jgi:hypothetical protein
MEVNRTEFSSFVRLPCINLRCKHDGNPVDVEEGDDDSQRHDAGDQREDHERQRDDAELKLKGIKC